MTSYPATDTTSLFAGEGPYRSRPATLAQHPGANPAVPRSGLYRRGTLLGRTTATDTYIPCVATATDGSQVPAAVTADDADTTTGGVTTPAYYEGTFAFEVMIVDGSWTYATLRAALRDMGSQIDVRSVGSLG